MPKNPNSVEAAPRDWRRFFLRIGAGVLILALLFAFLPREQLLAALRGFSVEIWLAGVSVYLCLHLIGVAKWRMLINAAGAPLEFAQAARAYYYGLFGNTFLPSVVGGDIVRAGLAMKMSRPRSAVLLGSLADRLIDSLGLAVVAGAGALLVPMVLDPHSRGIFRGLAVFVAAMIAGLALLWFALPARRFSYRLRRKLVRVRQAVSALLGQPGKMLIALASAVVLQTSLVVMNLWLGRLASIRNATFLAWLFVWPLAKLAAMLPLTQGGIGVREAAQGVLFAPFGVSMEKAVAVGLIFQAIVITGNLLGGVVAALIGRFVPSAAFAREAPARSARQAGISAALLLGGTLFFCANVLAIAWGTGSVGEEWVSWMAFLPGYGASFGAAWAGFAWGAGFGYLAGRLVGGKERPGLQ